MEVLRSKRCGTVPPNPIDDFSISSHTSFDTMQVDFEPSNPEKLRKIKNRMSAEVSRKKKDDEIDRLTILLCDYYVQLEDLQNENMMLKQHSIFEFTDDFSFCCNSVDFKNDSECSSLSSAITLSPVTSFRNSSASSLDDTNSVLSDFDAELFFPFAV